jgi:succinate dehydrogenase flavin-adding protein (antitoxin of CptAB toxin-antitoxin module)
MLENVSFFNKRTAKRNENNHNNKKRIFFKIVRFCLETDFSKQIGSVQQEKI